MSDPKQAEPLTEEEYLHRAWAALRLEVDGDVAADIQEAAEKVIRARDEELSKLHGEAGDAWTALARFTGNPGHQDLARAIRETLAARDERIAELEGGRDALAGAQEDDIAALAANENARLAARVEELEANPRDEYHTMAELYEYRMLYNAHAAKAWPGKCCKSWEHSDGELCFGGGWFVVVIELPTGQVTNHYEADDWDLFDVPEVERAPEWDGHTPAQAAERLRAALRPAGERDGDGEG